MILQFHSYHHYQPFVPIQYSNQLRSKCSCFLCHPYIWLDYQHTPESLSSYHFALDRIYWQFPSKYLTILLHTTLPHTIFLFFSFCFNGNLMLLRTSSAVLKGPGETWLFKYVKSFSLLLSFLALISFFLSYPCSCKTAIFSFHCFITSLISFAWNLYFL